MSLTLSLQQKSLHLLIKSSVCVRLSLVRVWTDDGEVRLQILTPTHSAHWTWCADFCSLLNINWIQLAYWHQTQEMYTVNKNTCTVSAYPCDRGAGWPGVKIWENPLALQTGLEQKGKKTNRLLLEKRAAQWSLYSPPPQICAVALPFNFVLSVFREQL